METVKYLWNNLIKNVEISYNVELSANKEIHNAHHVSVLKLFKYNF